jgi:hypothetical protein
MKKIIATTTINPPTEALIKYTKLQDWHVIVAGDLKTQHELFKSIDNLTYLSPEYQQEMAPNLSNIMGWNGTHRRSFAILEAYRMGADIIGIIDDDNIPIDKWGSDILIGKEIEVNFYNINDIVFDPIGCLSKYNHLWHRGFPLQKIPFRDYSNKTKQKIVPEIQAIFWNGDPDIDAICRMIYNPKTNFNNNEFPFASNKIAPFNCQNTLISKNVVKDYFLFPFIGRMEDIWAAYYAQAKNHKVVFSKPEVFSDRSLGTIGRYSQIEDMKKEYIGMEHTLDLLYELEKNPDNIKNFIPEKSWLAYQEWKKIFEGEDKWKQIN